MIITGAIFDLDGTLIDSMPMWHNFVKIYLDKYGFTPDDYLKANAKDLSFADAADYINKHYNEDITLEKLAEKFHFSKYYISHLFKDYAGVSPYDYLIIRRLYNFNDLVRGKTSISEACFLVGFNNYSNFFRLYKKHFKITPQQFKNSLID